MPSGYLQDAGRFVNRDSVDLFPGHLNLPGLNGRPERDPQLGDDIITRKSAPDRTGSAVEDCQHAIAG